MEKNKIEVGEYIRTKTGNITKVCKIKDTVVWTDEFMDIHCRYNEGVLEKTDILKHSKNIIDIIEVGDYVNGEKVIEVSQEPKYINFDTITIFDYKQEDIKSIVTKEQYKEMEYRV